MNAEDLLRRYNGGERDFRDADLRGAGADLSGARLVWTNLSEANFSGANLSGANLHGADLSGANLTKAKLLDTDLQGADLTGADLTGADLTKVILGGANLTGANLTKAKLNRAELTEATLTRAMLTEATLDSARLFNADLTGATLIKASLTGASLVRAKLTGAKLTGTYLTGTYLNWADLTGATLDNAYLKQANLLNIRIDAITTFKDAGVDGCRISRYTLESLNEYGGLTRGQRMVMAIEDGPATLRASYSGFLAWIHLLALAAFSFPYAWFCFQGYAEGAFVCPSEPCTTLRAALADYVWTGGMMNGEFAAIPFLIFCYSLLYNALRGVLLWKTKQLELLQESTGLPPVFQLEGAPWGTALKAATYGFYVNIILASVHTWHFLAIQVPVSFTG